MTFENLAKDLNCYASDSLAERIRGMVVDGELKEGYVFPKEEVFCKQLGVSRTTLREAYKALEASGYIKRVKGHGTVVKSVSEIIEASPLSDSIKLSSIEDVLEFRDMLETFQAKYAAIKATDEDIALLKANLETMKASFGNLQAFAACDKEFHILISKASGNSLMGAVMQNMEKTIYDTISLAFKFETLDNMNDAIASHEAIYKAIEAHDPATAYDAMSAHIRQVSARFMKHKDEFSS